MSSFLCLFTVLLLSSCPSNATVTLTSSADILCPGDTVVFTCVTTDTGRLVWDLTHNNVKQSFHSPGQINIPVTVDIFTLTLVSVTNSNTYQSTAVAHNVSVDYNGAKVSCSDDIVLSSKLSTTIDISSPLSPPLNLTGVVNVVNSSVTVSWVAPLDTPLCVHSYTVTVRNSCNSSQVMVYSTTDNRSSLNITDLTSDDEYSVTVAGRDAAGRLGQESEELRITLKRVYVESIGYNVQHTSVSIQWKLVEQLCCPLHVVQYLITHNVSSDQSTITVNRTNVTLYGVQPGETYTVEITPCYDNTMQCRRAGIKRLTFSIESTSSLSTLSYRADVTITTITTDSAVVASSTILLTPTLPAVEKQDAISFVAVAAAAILVLLMLVFIAVVLMIVLCKQKNKQEGPNTEKDSDIQYEAVTQCLAHVASKPLIQSLPKDTTVIEETRVEFPVQVIGTPHPTLTWYHNNTCVNNDYAYEISSNGTLTIVNAEMKHAGNYQLVATNSVGTVEGKFTLKVMSKTPQASSATGSSEVSHPVPMAEFGQYVSQNHANTNNGFTKLYHSLSSSEKGHPVTVAVTAANKPLNRFNNITVYDDNRVVLQPISGCPDSQGNYINASYIKGYANKYTFIACQGPIKNTLVDYWRMIWQEHVQTIVMVTNIREDKKIKCQQYWPDNDFKDFGPFRISLSDQQMFANFTIRLLQVDLNNISECPRQVTQYHFTSWPDHGVPEYGTPILAFHCRIKQEYKPSQGPMVVHCSAGVGRTGTFIAIDTILEQVKREGIVDVSEVITKMRQQRMKMVQTPEQYAFIHDVVLESVTCGDTQISARDLKHVISTLKARDQMTGKTQFEVQFEILNQVTPNPKEMNSKAAMKNKAKNRSMDFVPTDKHRVILIKEGDYIHASHVNSYKHKDAFIVTQNPMESTSGDFWQMIVERDCRVIVMLCALHEDGQKVCYQYWPNGGMTLCYGEFSIKILMSNQRDSYIERILSVVDKSGKSQQVIQFQILNWDPQGKCSNPQTIITVVEGVYKVQRRTDNKPIVVHCSDTVSRSGMFCAIATTIDRCKSESVVDVFQVVKAQRIQKPGLVLTVEQYQFVFQAVLTFLETFVMYSNFK